jgi:2-polyprenyl-3-methyl-5-hydroxy-6-metoxy-1,4-benzoquinol methylase
MTIEIIKDKILGYCEKYYANTPDKEESIELEIPFLGFSGHENHSMREPLIINSMDEFRNKRVFDFGCSFGCFSYLFALNGSKVVAFDINKEKVEIVNLVAKEYGLNVRSKNAIIDLEYFKNFQENADVVLFMNLFHHLTRGKDRDYALQMLKEVVRIGNVVYFQSGFNDLFCDNDAIEGILNCVGKVSNLGKDDSLRSLFRVDK